MPETKSSKPAMPEVTKARFMLVGLCLAWGLTWPAMRIALIDFPPFTMRTLSALVGAATIVVLARLAKRPVRFPAGKEWLDIVVVTVFNIVLFSLCASFAQLMTFTGRVAILVYTMPIWSTLLAYFVLGERLNAMRGAALLLCIGGMVTLIYPLASHGIPLGLLLALGSALSWSIGTIYLKWRRIRIDAFTLATWQLIIAFFIIVVVALMYERSFDPSKVSLHSLGGLIFAGFFGSGVAYYLWFRIIQILPATSASLGALASPVIGIVSSMALLGERPTVTDTIGYVLIFAASACVLLQPNTPTKIQPEHT